MFESADLDHVASKARWKSEAPKLRQRLLQAQWALGSKAKSSVLIIVGGVDGAGKGETVHLLNEWMDPRHIKTYAFSEPTDEETLRPDMWRYWRVLPPRGSIGVFYGSWYTAPIVRRVLGHDSDDALESALERIRRHETIGIFTIGGGVPRNWAQQVAPYLEISKVRLKIDSPLRQFTYGVRLCPEPVHWGGLSGCTYSEGVSWGKFKHPNDGGRFAEVFADATVTWPLIAKALQERFEKDPPPKKAFAAAPVVA